MEWRNELLSGISSLPKIGSPGRIVVFGEQAEPILTGSHEEDILMAVAQYGQGRVVAFSHDGYPDKLFEPDTSASGSADSLSTLKSNVRHWLNPGGATDGSARNYVDLSDWNIGENELATAKTAIWKGGNAGRIDAPRLLQFIGQGGGFVHAATPWGWLQLNPGKKLKQMPYWDVIKEVGLCYANDYLDSSGSELNVAENKADSAHLMKFLRANSSNPDALTSKPGLIRTLNSLPKDIRERNEMKAAVGSVWQMCGNRSANECPSAATPTTSHEQVAKMNLWKACVDAQKLTGVKAPGCDRFPGDFSSPPPLRCVAVEFSAQREEIHSTGAYAPAGQPIDVEVLSGNENDVKWTLVIGAHRDILSGDTLRRWPNVHVTKLLTKTSYRISAPFGGLIYLQSPNTANASIRVQLSNVVDAPQFVLGDGSEAAMSAWNARRYAPGLWADIIGHHVMITLPSASASSVDNPCEAMQLWDQVVRLDHELRGTDPDRHRRMWVVPDEQPVLGYMHCGYPIVTHLDVADPNNAEFMLNATNLREKGFWGMFHEIGHNMQRPEWTFDGTGEVTVNIFTLYAMDALCGRPPWIHEWLGGHVPAVVEYLTNGADFFKQWKTNPGVALFVYAQLARDFGWDSYRAVFRRYEAMTDQQKPSGDQQKMDEWFCQFSEVASHNLSPLAQFWGIPLTPDAGMRMARFPAYLPDDEITKAVPVRTDFILLIFPGLIRRP